MIPNESTKKKQHYRFKPSVNLSPCCIKNTQQGPSGTKLPRLNMCRSIIKSKHINFTHPAKKTRQQNEQLGQQGRRLDKILKNGGSRQYTNNVIIPNV